MLLLYIGKFKAFKAFDITVGVRCLALICTISWYCLTTSVFTIDYWLFNETADLINKSLRFSGICLRIFIKNNIRYQSFWKEIFVENRTYCGTILIMHTWDI